MSLLTENPAFYAIRRHANEDYRRAVKAKLRPQEWLAELIEAAHEINVSHQYGLAEQAIERTVINIAQHLITYPTAAAGQLRDQKREEYAQLQLLGFVPPRSIARGIGDNAAQRWLCEREVGPMRPAKLEPASAARPSRLPFGKYRGQTLAAIAKCDPGYLKWLVGKFEPSDLIDAAREALGQAHKAPGPNPCPALSVPLFRESPVNQATLH